MKRTKHVPKLVSIAVIVLLILVAGGLWYLNRVEKNVQKDSPQITDTTPAESDITDFDSCVAAGNPVMESFPEQCSANGETYVNSSDQDVPNDWMDYTSSERSFSLKHPADWTQPPADSLESCSPDLLLLGATSETVGACATENFGQMAVFMQPSDVQTLEERGYTNIESQAVTVGDREAIRMSGLSPGPHPVTGFGDPEGTETLQYVVELDSSVFVAEYVQHDTFPDVRDNFRVMIEQTVQFL